MTQKFGKKPAFENDIETADVPDEIEFDEDGNPIEETTASDSIKAHGVPTRLDIMTNTVSAMSKMGDTELTKWWQDAIKTSEGYASTGLDTAAKNKASINAKPSATGANPMGPFPYVPVVKEDLKAVFDGMGITESDLQDKMLTLFDSAVNMRVAVERARIEEEAEEALIEATEEIRQDLIEKVDQYLDYAATEFVAENQIAIENALRLELMEDFLDDLKIVFENHYVEIPEDKYDVVNGLSEKVVDLESKLNSAVNENLSLNDEILDLKASSVFDEVAEGLSITDTNKLKTLVESVEFDGDLDALRQKLVIIKEANFKTASKKPAVKTGIIAEESVVITGDVDNSGTVEVKKPDVRVAKYVDAISRTNKGRF